MYRCFLQITNHYFNWQRDCPSQVSVFQLSQAQLLDATRQVFELATPHEPTALTCMATQALWNLWDAWQQQQF